MEPELLGLGKPMNVFCRQLIPDIFTVFFVIGLRWGQLFCIQMLIYFNKLEFKKGWKRKLLFQIVCVVLSCSVVPDCLWPHGL